MPTPHRQLRVRIDCIESGEVRDSLTLTFDLTNGASMPVSAGEALGTAAHRLFDEADRKEVAKAFNNVLK